MFRDENYKIKLRDFISGSKLNEAQKELWDLFLKVSDADEDEAVYEAVAEGDDSLKLLTKHLYDKIKDMNREGRRVSQGMFA